MNVKVKCEAQEKRRYEYTRRLNSLWVVLFAALPVIGILIVAKIGEFNPFRDVLFLIIITWVVADVFLYIVLRWHAPTAFEIGEDFLIVEWIHQHHKVSLSEIRALRMTNFLLPTATFFKAGSKTVIVFSDLDNYEEFKDFLMNPGVYSQEDQCAEG